MQDDVSPVQQPFCVVLAYTERVYVVYDESSTEKYIIETKTDLGPRVDVRPRYKRIYVRAVLRNIKLLFLPVCCTLSRLNVSVFSTSKRIKRVQYYSTLVTGAVYVHRVVKITTQQHTDWLWQSGDRRAVGK